MNVKQLIKHLETFDPEHYVVVKNEGADTETGIDSCVWEFDGYCKLVINKT